MVQDPKMTISCRLQQLGISSTTTWRILRDHLNLNPYKIQLTQKLNAIDHEQRRKFDAWLLEKVKLIMIFSDEAHFNFNGYVNRQNCRIWGNGNPREFHEKTIHLQCVTVWCVSCAEGVI